MAFINPASKASVLLYMPIYVAIYIISYVFLENISCLSNICIYRTSYLVTYSTYVASNGLILRNAVLNILIGSSLQPSYWS